MKLSYGTSFGTNAMRKLESSIFLPVFIFGLGFFLLFSIITYAIVEKSVEDAMYDTYQAGAQVFTDTIRQDLVMGLTHEVYRECKSFFNHQNVVSIDIVDSNGKTICSKANKSSNTYQAVTKKIFFGDEKKIIAATVEVKFYNAKGERLLFNSVILLLVSTLFLIVMFYYLVKHLISKKVKHIVDLSHNLEKMNTEKLKSISSVLPENTEREIQLLYQGVEIQARKVENYQKDLVETEKMKALNDMSSVLAHDMKAPLSNLLVIKGDDDLNDITKTMLNTSVDRISKIVEELMSLEKVSKRDRENSKVKIDVAKVVTEQFESLKYFYANSENTKVKMNLNGLSAIFIAVNKLQFQRALSNLIKNAKEAISNKKNGLIELNAYLKEQQIHVEVVDNGIGMDENTKESIGARGFSSGKSSGNGLGVYQVKNMLASCKGKLEIESKDGSGAKIKMIIPQHKPTESITDFSLNEDDVILILDDDDLVHDMWRAKLSWSSAKNNKTYYFKTPIEVANWVEHEKTFSNKVAFFDYNLKASATGLDLLKKYPFAQKILVTGEADYVNLSEQCLENKVTLVDKGKFNNLKLHLNVKKNIASI